MRFLSIKVCKLIFKMGHKHMDDYLYTNAKRWWQWGCKRKESRVCTRVVSTGSEGIQQWKFITIRRKESGFDEVQCQASVQLWVLWMEWMPRCPEFWD